MMVNKVLFELICFGLMLLFIGLVVFYGQEIVWVVCFVCQEINVVGGIFGWLLELIIEDDGSFLEIVVFVVCCLVDEYCCLVIIGNLLFNLWIVVVVLVVELQWVFYFNFFFYEGSIFSCYFFYFVVLFNQQIDKMMLFMFYCYGLKIFFVGSNYEWLCGLIDVVKCLLLVYNGEIVGEVYLLFGVMVVELENFFKEVVCFGVDIFVLYFVGVE